MDDIYTRIKIIPVSQCLIHEGIIEKLVDQIASNFKNDGVMKNPIIVTLHQGRTIVLDGMHRFAAIEQLGIPDILVFEVDYFSKEVVLEPPHRKEDILERTLNGKIFPPKSTTHLISGRPLRVDLPLSVLNGPNNLETKNRLLQGHLKWCHENNRVRFYPESVTIFAD